MARARRSNPRGQGGTAKTRSQTVRSGRATTAPPRAKSILELPADVSVPSEDIGDYTWLVYGERKIGKTSLCARFADPFFIMFEPGGRGLSIKQQFVQTWPQFLEVIELLEQKPDYCQTVVIDTGYMCYERCFQWGLKEMGIDDPHDASWGAAYKLIEKEFTAAYERLEALGLGMAVTAHSEVREVKHRSGLTYDKMTLQLSKAATRWFAGTLDVIAYYHFDENGRRMLTIAGSSEIEAGARCEGHFKYEGTGNPIETIPMGDSADEAYKNLSDAFKNQLEEAVIEVDGSRPRSNKRRRRGR
jgi:AAA domain-containing protein